MNSCETFEAETPKKQIEVNSCMDLNQSGATYLLTQDVSGYGWQGSMCYDKCNCFRILGENITLDCDGHKIAYAPGGIRIGSWDNPANNIVIKNCNLDGLNNEKYSQGIFIRNSNNIALRNNIIINWWTTGIRADKTIGTTISNNNISNNREYGISISYTPISYGEVISLLNVSGNNIYGNDATDHSYNLANFNLGDVTAENNWWGTADPNEIALQISDNNTISFSTNRSGIVDFEPYLCAPYRGGTQSPCT